MRRLTWLKFNKGTKGAMDFRGRAILEPLRYAFFEPAVNGAAPDIFGRRALENAAPGVDLTRKVPGPKSKADCNTIDSAVATLSAAAESYLGLAAVFLWIRFRTERPGSLEIPGFRIIGTRTDLEPVFIGFRNIGIRVPAELFRGCRS
jgi:hypothetical protein